MRILLAGAVLVAGLAMPAQASAYTLVLRSGERVDIGDAYRLNGSQVEFAAGSTVVRLDLRTIDLVATARENNETVGAFVARASSRPLAPRPQATDVADASSTLTVTNADLEPYRLEREQRDVEAATRGVRANDAVVPPPPPSGRGLSRDELLEWRNGFLALQDRVDAQQAQIDGIRDEVDYRSSRPFRFGLSYRYNFGPGPIGYRNGSYYSYANPPYPYLRSDDEFAQLNSRLIDLEIEQRATKLERDRYVERARMAGVPPGWLRE